MRALPARASSLARSRKNVNPTRWVDREDDVDHLDDVERKYLLRHEVYERAGIDRSVRSELEHAVSLSPARPQSRGSGLYNMKTLGTSPKSDKPTHTESHTVEQIHKYECDLDPQVVALYTQVPIRQLVRERENRRHVTNARLDALVFKADRILVRECKTEDWLKAAVDKDGSDWRVQDSQYVHVPLANWSSLRGLSFEAWCPPSPSGWYGSNLAALVQSLGVARDKEFLDQAERLVHHLSDGCIREMDSVLRIAPWVSHQHVQLLLATRRLHGTLKSRLLDRADFCVSLVEEGIVTLDAAGMSLLSTLDAPAAISNWLSTTPAHHVAIAIKRLERMQRMQRGDEPWSRYFQELYIRINDSWADPNEALRCLVPQYAMCGNHTRRLQEDMYDLLASFGRGWEKGHWPTRLDAWGDYKAQCASENVLPASKTTFYLALRKSDPEKRALATGGVRAFQQVRRRSPPTKRSVPSVKARHTVHVDSTALDIRTFVFPGEPEFLIRGWVYVCRDVHGMPLARSYVIGNARTQGVALLWRDYVYRWGELPFLVHKDRGPDQTANWSLEFATGRFELRFQQTANSRANQPAEDLNNHVNSYVCHRLDGTTLNDRFGRAIDGKFKSLRMARHAFGFITAGIDDFLFLDAPEMLTSELVSFRNDAARRIELYGSGGHPVAYDDDFRIATSLPVKSYTCSEKAGIRTTDGYFLNTELQTSLRTRRPSRVLADSANPALLWVHTENRWLKAWRSDATSYLAMPRDERLVRYFTQRDVRAAIRAHHEELKIARGRSLRKQAEHEANAHPTTEAPCNSAEDLDAVPDAYSVTPGNLYKALQ